MGLGDGGAARRYHDATKHSLASVQGDRHVLDLGTMPIPFKVYTGLDGLSLARDFHASPLPALRAIAGEAGGEGLGQGAPQPLDLDLVAHLLYFTAGVLRRRSTPVGDTFFRAAACTGNLHHVEIYLVAADLPGLEAGVYHFGAHDFALRRLREGDHRALLLEATASEPRVAAAPVTLALTSTFWRNAWKYRARAYRHAFWDAGTQLANLLAVSAARAVPAHVVVGFVDAAMTALLDLDPMREATVALVALGDGAAPPESPPEIAPLGHEVLPVSRREVDYPAIREAHAATSLASSQEVAAWRAAAKSDLERHLGVEALAPSDAPTRTEMESRLEPPAGTIVPLAPLSAAVDVESTPPIEAVILRRGSARAFAREPIFLAALSAILRSVTRGVPGDLAPAGGHRAEIYAIVHAVDGLASGAFWYDRERESLVLLRAGSFRRDAGFLGLGQQLPADAAVNLYWLTDLRPLLGRLGDRGYRAAQLEAAIEGGKTYLAAYALGLGASGLTFFDDDVTQFFSPHAAGRSVMFLMAVGVPRRLRPAAAGG